MDMSLTDSETQISDSKKGGWITFIFIAVTVAGTTIAGGGWGGNLIVYLIEDFHVESINAAQVGNVVTGCTFLLPVIGAIVADSVGCFPVISVSYGTGLLVVTLFLLFLQGTVLLFITAIPSIQHLSLCLRESSSCKTQSNSRFAILYAGVALASIGLGGTRFTLATMGADQHADGKSQNIFFNWYFFTLNFAVIVGATVLVYVEDNIGWLLGFGLCIAANAFGFVIFLLGKRFYLQVKNRRSPYLAIARVVVAAFRKRNIPLSTKSQGYYIGCEQGAASESLAMTPTTSLRFLNRAALRSDGDIGLDGSVVKPWRLCTVQQVEHCKSLVKIFPVWSTSIFLGTPIAIQSTMTILQALSMDRHIGPHFEIPAGSIIVTSFISTTAALSLIDQLFLPAWQKLTGRYATPFQQIGLGHILNVVSMATSALVEVKRLKIAKQHYLQAGPTTTSVPMLALWLLPQLVVAGVGEAFHFPAQVALYYQEFPISMKNIATAMISLTIAVAFYLATFLIDVIRRVTSWLPADINTGRIDNLYWVLAAVGIGNFCYFLVCTHYYKYQAALEKTGDDINLPDWIDGWI